MEHPCDPGLLPEAARKVLSGPAPMKLLLARGLAPLPPVALVSALYALSYDADGTLRETAERSLGALPEVVLHRALGSADLPGAVLDVLASRYAGRGEVLSKVLRHGSTLDDTVVRVAKHCDEATAELIAVNEQRLLRSPKIIEVLYFNERTRMSTTDRMVELAARHGLKLDIPGFEGIVTALKLQLVPEAGDEPLPSDEAFALNLEEASVLTEDEFGDDEDGEFRATGSAEKVQKSLLDMTVTERIRLAMVGNAAQRAMLIRSPNRMVSSAVLDSPKLNDDEVVKFACSRSVGDEVLRKIASDRRFSRHYEIKMNLCFNPKTPLGETLKLLNYLREHDVKKLAATRGLPSGLVQAAAGLLKKRSERKNQ